MSTTTHEIEELPVPSDPESLDDIPTQVSTDVKDEVRWSKFCGFALNAFKFHQLDLKNSERMSRCSALYRLMHYVWNPDTFEPEMRAMLASPLPQEDYLHVRMGAGYIPPPEKKAPRTMRGKNGTLGQRAKNIWSNFASEKRVATVRLAQRKPVFLQTIQADLDRIDKLSHVISAQDAYMAGVRGATRSLFTQHEEDLL